MLKYILLTLLIVHLPLRAQDLDAGVAKLSDNLATGISKSGSKKISVIDFTDLQGRDSDLGRFLAEQLSVALVNSGKDFAVLDRANMKSILDEHKLTASGLVNPDNARKIGQFAGVDAIVLGSIAPFGQSLFVTAKAISTETTQVLAATKMTIARSKDIDAMYVGESASPTTGVATEARPAAPSKPTTDFVAPNGTNIFDNLEVDIISFRPTTSNEMLVVLSLKNLSKSYPLRVGLNKATGRNGDTTSAFIVDDQGNVLEFLGAQGIGVPQRMAYNNTSTTFEGLRVQQAGYESMPQNGWRDALNSSLNQMTDIGIGQSIIATIGFSTRDITVGTTFRLQIELIVVEMKRGDIGVSSNNVMIPGIQLRQP